MSVEDFAREQPVPGNGPRRGDLVRGPWPLEAVRSDVSMPVDMWVEADGVVIRAFLPGVRADQVGLVVGDDWLDICAEPRAGLRAPDASHILRELPRRPVTRTLPLPEGVDPSAMEVALADGVLEIRIPWDDARTRAPGRPAGGR